MKKDKLFHIHAASFRKALLASSFVIASVCGVNAQTYFDYYYNFNITGTTSVCTDGTTVYQYSGPISELTWSITGGTFVNGINYGSTVSVRWNTSGGELSATGTHEDCWYDPEIWPPTQYCNRDHYTSNYFSVTGQLNSYLMSGGSYCSGGSGVNVSLNGSQTGVNYQLKINGSNSGSPVAGTGGTLNWGNQTTGGTYTVVGTKTSTGCSATVGSTTVTVISLPTAFTVGGGGNYCSGGSGLSITLSSSQTTVAYQLKLNGSNQGLQQSGTGGALTWPNKTSAGTYTVTAISSGPGCVNDMSGSAVINIDPTSVGGTVNGSGTWCSSAGGTLTLSGHTGSVVRWESNNGSGWTNISNTSTSQGFSGLTSASTQYRAYVASGTCPGTYSSTATINVNSNTVGGTVSSSTTACSSASGSLSLSGHVGAVQRWEYNDGGGWTTISNTSTNQSYNVSATRQYRAVVKNGVCAETPSSVATITIHTASVGGTVSGSVTACATASGTLTLSGHNGSIVRWESNNGSGWSNISNTTTSQAYSGVTATTSYRALIQNGVCSSTYSSTATVTIDAATVGGSVSSSVSACASASGTLTLSGHTGAIQRWEYNDGSGWVTIANTTTSQAYNVSATRSYRAAVKSGVCAEAFSSTATITISPATVGGTASGGGTICTGSSGTITLSGHTGSVVRWEHTIPSGWQTIANTTTSQAYTSLTETRAYRAIVKSGVCAEAPSSNASLIVDVATVAGTLASSADVYAASATGVLTLSGQVGTIQRWEENTGSGWSPFSHTETTYAYNNTQSKSYRVAVKSGACPELISSVASINLYPALSVTPAGPHVINYGQNVQLTTTATYYSYQWYNNGSLIAGATAQQYTALEPGKYSVQVKGSATAATATSALITVNPFLFGYEGVLNAESTTIVLQENVAENASLFLLPSTSIIQAVAYKDGIGRTFQSIAVGQSPQGGDIVSPMASSKNGLADTAYLAYSVGVKSGHVRNNALRGTPSNPATYTSGEQYQFYQGTAKVATDTYPFARTSYRNTPDARVTEQGAPGSDWQPGSTHTVRSTMALNSATMTVRYWKPDGTTSALYPVNSVQVAITTDENNNQVRIFTNVLGQTVLKQVQIDDNLGGFFQTAWLDTYYVYDAFGRLIVIIPPKAMDVLGTGTSLNAYSSSVADLIYRFTYDSKDRIIVRKEPGADEQYLVYDNFDRLVFAQDGHLRAQNKWTFTKYDRYNRTITSGIYDRNVSRAALQMEMYTRNYDAEPFFDVEQGSTTHGYSNQVYPTTNLVTLSVNYYDHYDFNRNGTPDYSYDNTHLTGQSSSAQLKPRGRATGTKSVIVDQTNTVTTDWLIGVVFYDAYGRGIQTVSNNHLYLTVADKNTSIYDFAGRITKTKATHHQSVSASIQVIDRPVYDHAGRVLKLYRQVNSDPEVQVAEYEYNAIGQLVDKKLHVTGSTAIQSIDYRYTIRGWLKSINNATLTNDGVTNNETTDLFGLELIYQTVASGISNTPYYNSNVSAMKWKGPGQASGDLDQRSYSYVYDKTNRLKTSTFKAQEGAAWSRETNTLNESLTYDHNGNIRTLTRNQNQRGLSGLNVTSTPQAVDNLTYTYATGNLNRLEKVEDAVALGVGTQDFKNNANLATEYTYNTSGDLTADQNKGITSITYNQLGKQQVVLFSDGRKVEYIYSSTGEKLTTKTWQGVTLSAVTNYVGPYVYEGASPVLSYFGSPEGRVVMNGSAAEYQYAISDHQGNTRVIFSSATPAAHAYTANMEATSNSDFQGYPSGGNRSSLELFDHTDFSGSTYTYSQLLNGGNNSQAGVGKSFKVYPGDKVKIEAYAKYYNPQGTSSNLAGFAGALLSAFSLSPPAGGETGTASYGVNQGGEIIAAGGGKFPNGHPGGYVNILVLDKKYNFLDLAYEQIDGGEQVGPSPKTEHDYLSREYTIKEEGYVYLFVSNENATLVDIYFDDVVITRTPTNIIQYNEYYPFGLATANSWTRENTLGNNYLYNGPTETNTTTGLIETHFRTYDPVLARMNAVDPMSTKYSSVTPYNYSFNNPVNLNDPSGADPNVPGDYDYTGSLIDLMNNGSWSPGMSPMTVMDPGGASYIWSPASAGGYGITVGAHISTYNFSSPAPSHEASVYNFLAAAWDSPYGGHWNTGGGAGFLFRNGEQALAYGNNYNNHHGSWTYTQFGGEDATTFAYVWAKSTGQMPSVATVNFHINQSYAGRGIFRDQSWHQAKVSWMSAIINALDLAQGRRFYFGAQITGNDDWGHNFIWDRLENTIYEINHLNADGNEPGGFEVWRKGLGAKAIGYAYDMDEPIQNRQFWEFRKGRGMAILGAVNLSNSTATFQFMRDQVGQSWPYWLTNNNCKHFALDALNAGGAGLNTQSAFPYSFDGTFTMKWINPYR